MAAARKRGQRGDPLRKFVARNFSAKRMERIRATALGAWKVKPIFAAAKKVLRIKNPKETRLIFFGQEMRPFFEAVRAINEVEKVFPRKNIRYFVSPLKVAPSDYAGVSLRSKAYPQIVRKRGVQRFLDKIRQFRIVSGGIGTYYFFDVTDRKYTFGLAEDAMRKIKPDAKINRVDQHSKMYDDGIMYSSMLSKPTVKSADGKLSAGTDLEARDQYLAFQWLLQKHVDGMQRKRK